ncbi:hypothetical protein [Pseudorhodoplanes sp.]|uniref:hypothetical protein n=1 Tax=Pseudorhodoplanes sp. TaxID=1934341 RepID=UPI003918E4A3
MAEGFASRSAVAIELHIAVAWEISRAGISTYDAELPHQKRHDACLMRHGFQTRNGLSAFAKIASVIVLLEKCHPTHCDCEF